mmetsp:Transcript_66612/g.210916  ORF Transcript_66612/g.210916 Transcript_66612/m.210916 type:complete len:223 (+) Transcript_66612:2745-3413(+)
MMARRRRSILVRISLVPPVHATDHVKAKRKSESTHLMTMSGSMAASVLSSANSSVMQTKRRCRAVTSWASWEGAASRTSRRRYLSAAGTIQSKSPRRWSLASLPSPSGSVSSHERVSGRHPSWCGSRYTMPQRDTVAGEATARSATSKIMLMTLDIWMISLFMRQSFLLSSSTVFMFSIQTASTGPSNITHLRSGLVSVAQSRNFLASTPSCHSWLTGSNWP